MVRAVSAGLRLWLEAVEAQEEQMSIVHCIRCEKALEFGTSDTTQLGQGHAEIPYMPNPTTIQVVAGGLVCRTYGNYGSVVFDPSPGEMPQSYEFYVCDDCAKTHIIGKAAFHVTTDYEQPQAQEPIIMGRSCISFSSDRCTIETGKQISVFRVESGDGSRTAVAAATQIALLHEGLEAAYAEIARLRLLERKVNPTM